MFISSDTNVWIDFHEIGHLDHPFRLNFEYYISRDTFQDEFLKSELMRNDLMNFGLHLADVTDDEFVEAVVFQERYQALSIYDTFALAIAKTRKWMLLTGDMPLRRAADMEGVEVHGAIWIYDQLKAQGKMTEDEYDDVISELIEAVKNGRCRLPIVELYRRKRS